MNRIISFLDSLDFSPVTITLTVFGLAIVRLFLENFSSPEVTGMFPSFVGIISYATLYGMLLLFFALVISLLTKKNTLWSTRVMTILFPIVIATPIIDLIFSKGAGYCVGYIQSGEKSLLNLFFTYLLPHGQSCGITPGLRIQIIAGSIGVGFIVWMMTRSYWKSVLGIFAGYGISFIGGALPLIASALVGNYGELSFFNDAKMSLLSSVHYPSTSPFFEVVPIEVTNVLIARIQLVGVIIGLGIVWAMGHFHSWRGWWLGSIKKIPIAGIHFVLLAFGLFVGYFVGTPTLLWPDILGIIILIIAVFLACWVVGISNDIEDVAIDTISNPDRPLVLWKVSTPHLEQIQSVSMILAITAGFLVNYNTLYCIAIFLTSYSLHSTGIRLKRFWLTSSVLIIISGISMFLAGYFTLSTDQSVSHIPITVILMLVGMLFPYTIIKDVPDIAGDTIGKIKTFPILYGIKATYGILIISTIGWLLYLRPLIPWFFAIGIIIPLVLFLLKPKLIHQKTIALGLPVGLWAIGILIHMLTL